MKKPKKPLSVTKPRQVRREAKTKKATTGVHRPTRKELGAKAAPAKPEANKRKPMTIGDMLLAQARQRGAARDRETGRPIPIFDFKPYQPAPGVVPKDRLDRNGKIAMDSAGEAAVAWAAQSVYQSSFDAGMTFLGYPYLSELAQRPEYRRISEVISTEMTRKWIKFQSTEEATPEVEDGQSEAAGPDGKPKPPGAGKPDPKAAKAEAGKPDAGKKPAPTFDEVKPNAERESGFTDERAKEMVAQLLATGSDPAKKGEVPEGELPKAEGEIDELEEQQIDGQPVAGVDPEDLEDPNNAAMAGEIDETDSTERDANDPQQAAPKSDKAKKIKELEDAMKLLDVQEIFRRLALQDGFFGRAHLYIDTGDTLNPDELRMPIGDGRSKLSKLKVSKDKPVLRLATVEPVWCYPSNYNADDPLRPDWYNPDMWFVQGKELHASRLLIFVGREVPDLCKPAFSFGGLSMTQMAMPYVNNWLRVRQSVSELIWSFSVSGLATSLDETLTPQGDDLLKRVDLFNLMRDNRNCMIIDKEKEEFFNVSTPLSTLDTLQAQAQEHMASVSGIPLVKLLGIQPAGLNASSEGEIRTFYDWIAAYQEHFFRPNLQKVVDFVMLSIWGEVDEEITFVFNPLWSLDEKQLAEVEKSKMDTATGYISAGVLHPEEVRRALANDPESGYTDIDPDDAPEDPMAGIDPMTGLPVDPEADEDETGNPNAPPGAVEPGSESSQDGPKGPTPTAAPKGGAIKAQQ